MAINFEARLDNKNIIAAVREAQAAMSKLSQAVDGVGEHVDDATSSIKEMIKQAAALGGISLGMAGVKEFLSQMINVRKEMEGFQISLSTLLGDQEKADKMFASLKDFAVTTPLALNSLASGAQTMLGFNIEAERVIPTLKQIGDISMGDAQKFNSLVLSFSQMSATGKLMGQDLMQMINAGFNPLSEMSRTTGKSIAELKKEMEAGAISSQMVADAFASATSEGGKFYGMLSKQGEGLAGKINTLNGALDDMYNSLAESSEGAINTAIGGITLLIQNYDKVGKAIATLVATYGAYKAALIATSIAESVNVVGIGMTLKSIQESILATKAATAAQKLFNLAVKANPYVLAATAIVAVVGAMWTFASRATTAADAQKKLNKELDDFNDNQQKQREEVEKLIQVIQDQSATDAQRILAYDALKLKCKELTDKYSMERLAVLSLTDAYKELNHAQELSSMAVKLENFNRMVRVYNDIQRNIQKRKQGKKAQLNEESTAYINAHDLLGMNVEDIATALKTEIDKQRAEIEAYKKANEKKEESTYKEDAKKAYQEWADAKKEYEKLIKSQTFTAAQRSEALKKMEDADNAYEKLTGTKASKLAEQSSKRVQQAKDDASSLEEIREQQAKDKARKARDMELDAEQARIDAMKEGTDKTIRQLKLDYIREEEAIKREEEDLKEMREKNAKEQWEAENPDKVRKDKNAWETSGAKNAWSKSYKLSNEDQDYFDAKAKANVVKYDEALGAEEEKANESMNDFLKKYGDYQQKRLAITKEYKKKIEEAQTEGEKMTLTAELDKELSDLDTKFGKSSSKIQKLWKSTSKATRKELKSMISDLKLLQNAVADGTITPDEETLLKKLGFTQEDIEQFKQGEKNIEDVAERISQVQDQLEQASTSAQNFWDALNNSDGSIDMDKVGKSFNDMMSNINAYAQGLQALSNVLSNGQIKGAMEDVNTIIGEIGTGASVGASAGGGWGALIGAIIGVASGVGQVINDHINDDQIKAIEKAQKKINQLQKSYEELGKAVEDTYSEDKAANINEEIVNLQRQNMLIKQQIRQERAKKDTDDSAIAAYEDAIYENNQKIKQLKEEAKDAIFGSDINTAIENFANAYAEAWGNNTNRTRTAKEQVRKMMQDMVKESIKAATEASGAMERIREKLTDYYRDGILSDAEQQAIYAEAEKLQYELDKKFSWADDLLDDSNSFTEGSSGGFKSMSQESADELNGRFTAGQITLDSILSQTMLIYASNQQMVSVTTEGNETLKEIRNLMISMSGNVEDIASYTKELKSFGAKYDKMIAQLEKL